MKDKEDNRITLTIVVSGQPFEDTWPAKQTLSHVVEKVLRKTGNTGQDPSSWELRDSSGRVLDLSMTLREADLSDGMTLFLNPKAGAGGQGIECSLILKSL